VTLDAAGDRREAHIFHETPAARPDYAGVLLKSPETSKLFPRIAG
jgi:hypothetical protein